MPALKSVKYWSRLSAFSCDHEWAGASATARAEAAPRHAARMSHAHYFDLEGFGLAVTRLAFRNVVLGPGNRRPVCPQLTIVGSVQCLEGVCREEDVAVICLSDFQRDRLG